MAVYIPVAVRARRAAVLSPPQEIVCGNSDCFVQFFFDSEWEDYPQKTARFVWKRDGKPYYADVLFTGETVQVPVLYGTSEVAVGVYAGDIRTTAPARIPCAACITDGDPIHENPPADVYDQLNEYLAQLTRGMTGSPAGATVPLMFGTAVSISGETTRKEDA